MSAPTFGITRRRRNNKNNHGNHGSHGNAFFDSSRDFNSTGPHRGVHGGSHNSQSSTRKVPVLDVQTYARSGRSQVGEIVLNNADDLLYYNNGIQWMPLAPMNPAVQSLTIQHEKNILIEAPNSFTGIGGNVAIYAGHGGTADGVIKLNVAGEDAVVVSDGRVHFDANISLGDNKSIQYKISRASVSLLKEESPTVTTLVTPEPPGSPRSPPGSPCGSPVGESETDVDTEQVETATVTELDDGEVTSLGTPVNTPNVTESRSLATVDDKPPVAHTTGLINVVTIKLNLSTGTTAHGTIQNKELYSTSWVNTTVVNSGGTGMPYVWLSKPVAGSVEYHVHAMGPAMMGAVTELELHLEIRNQA